MIAEVDQRFFIHINIDRIDLTRSIFRGTGNFNDIIARLQAFFARTAHGCFFIFCLCRYLDAFGIRWKRDLVRSHIGRKFRCQRSLIHAE